MRPRPRTVPALEQTLWALPDAVTPASLTAITALARIHAGTRTPRLVMHRRTLDAICRAVAADQQMAVSRDYVERHLQLRVETDLMYPDGVIFATAA